MSFSVGPEENHKTSQDCWSLRTRFETWNSKIQSSSITHFTAMTAALQCNITMKPRTNTCKIIVWKVIYDIFFRRAPQQMVRTHRSLEAYCAIYTTFNIRFSQKIRLSGVSFVTEEPSLVVTVSGKFIAEYYHPFTALKWNLGCDKFKDDHKVQTDMTWWLIA
jgi:hypothetical protein